MTKPIKVSKAPHKTLFKTCRDMMIELRTRVIKTQSRKSLPIWGLVQMSQMYVVKSSDKVVFTRDGGISLKQFSASDFQHTKKTWEVMGITKGCLPNIVYVDPVTGVEYEAYMTMNGLEVDQETEEYKRMIATLTSFPASMVHEAMQVANDIYKYFVGRERDYNKSP